MSNFSSKPPKNSTTTVKARNTAADTAWREGLKLGRYLPVRFQAKKLHQLKFSCTEVSDSSCL